MGAIGLNPIRLDRIGLDPIRINAIKLGVPGAFGTERPYIDPEVLASLRAVCICYGKSNDDPDRAVVKNLVDPDNPFVISNAAYTEGSGYADKDSPYYGAFVTDGIDDLITSTKTVQEMLGGSTEFTAVSMIHLISPGQDVDGAAYTNYIRTSDNYWTSNRVSNVGKTGIYGYSFKQSTPTVINNILGDKGDYTTDKSPDTSEMFRANFSVEGFKHAISGTVHASSVAWYWTIIANKVLTTDQINQVIAYFNLDRTLNPDILCNTIKQGITNENHAEFGDKLIDFSGNGRDIQLNNIAWKGDSGIGKYEVDFSTWSGSGIVIGNGVGFKIERETTSWWGMSAYGDTSGLGSFTIKVTNCHDLFVYRYKDEDGNWKDYPIESDGIYTLPASGAKDDKDNYRFFNSNPNATYNGLTITQIPSHAGALCLAGVNDFGKVTGMPIYKDYTVVADYERLKIGYIEDKGTPAILSKSYTAGQGAFLMNLIGSTGEHMNAYTFGNANSAIFNDLSKKIYYQSKYKMQGFDMTIGSGVDGDSLWLGTVRDNDSRFFNGAIYSLMTFPYSMSEFLIERQLKKHKLGTLYPDMVEWRPIYTSNVNDYTVTRTAYFGEAGQFDLALGSHYSIGTIIRIYVKPNGAADEVTSIKVNGVELTYDYVDSNYGYAFNGTLSDKFPQKINITIDEYIRYEDIDFSTAYPFVPLLQGISWGDKLKVGDEVTFIGFKNILPDLYTRTGEMKLNGNNLVTNSSVIVEKSMKFEISKNYTLDNNEPKVILSPRLLSIPNSSYKILGYIPDISGHGNNGVINNSAYAEGSGVNKDGSYQFDGVDDFVTIPTTVGGKQVLMKVNWQKEDTMIYNQNPGEDNFAIYTNDYNNNNLVNAYASRNNGSTYIDGILNNNILATQLKDVTHNITITNENVVDNTIIPVIGANAAHDNFYAQMSLYDLMLFDEISTDDKIQELNEYVGVEAKVEKPDYYWDAYGKTNSDADKDTIQQRGIAVGDYDLINYNHAYEGMSGYNGYPVVFGANKTWEQMPTGTFTWNIDDNKLHITKALIAGNGLLFSYVKLNGSLLNVKEIPSFKIKVSGLEGKSKLWYRYLKTEDAISETIAVLENGTHELPKSYTPSDSLHDGVWVGFSVSPISEGVKEFDCDITIEVLPEYENSLVYDGVDDYSENVNIPVLTDYTYIFKRGLLNDSVNSASMNKGLTEQQRALVIDFSNSNGNIEGYSFGNGIPVSSLRDSDIIYGTTNNVNGTSITKGSNPDSIGINISKFTSYYKQMVFYKLILYPKTISLLEINFLKNLMEKDEIIDLTNPIFIQE